MDSLQAPFPEVLKATEVSERLKIGLSTVYELFGSGELKGFRIHKGRDKGVRIFAHSLTDMMERNSNTAKFQVGQPEKRGRGRPRKNPSIIVPSRTDLDGNVAPHV